MQSVDNCGLLASLAGRLRRPPPSFVGLRWSPSGTPNLRSNYVAPLRGRGVPPHTPGSFVAEKESPKGDTILPARKLAVVRCCSPYSTSPPHPQPSKSVTGGMPERVRWGVFIRCVGDVWFCWFGVVLLL